MHVKKLTLSNFKAIEDFDAEFQGGVYLVTGENEIGKSTMINAIGMLLTGTRSDNLLTKGKDKGFAKAVIGEGDEQYEVSLNFSEKNPRGTLTIQKVGSVMKSDRLSALQEIFKYQDFDANEFVKWSETAEGRRKQVAIVKSLLPSTVQKRIAEIDADIEAKKEERKTTHSDIKVYEGKTSKAGVTEKDLKKYEKPLDQQELIDKKVEGAKRNEARANVLKRKAERESLLSNHDTVTSNNLSEHDRTIAELERKLNEAKEAKEKYISDRVKLKDELTTLIKQADDWLLENKEIDLNEVQQELDKIDVHNKKHTAVKDYLANTKKLKSLLKSKDKQDAAIQELLDERQKLITDASLPIEGLDFDEDGLTLNGVPFRPGEVSTSQEMEIAAKLIIAKNPTVKVFRIAQGESLGRARLKAIVDFASKAGYQGFIEEVHRGQDELIIHEYTDK